MKTKSFKLDLFPLIAMGCALVAIIMFFLPFVTYSTAGTGVTTSANISGFVAAFAGKFDTIAGSVKIATETKLVAVALIAFILIVVGLLAAAFNFFVECKFERIIAFVSMGALVAGGILLFFARGNFVSVNEIPDSFAKYYGLGVGAVIAAILAFAGAACEAIKMFKK